MAKQWIEEEGKHTLIFTPFYEPERMATIYEEDDIWLCDCKLINAERDYLTATTLEEAKQEVETVIAAHYEGQRDYYHELMVKFLRK